MLVRLLVGVGLGLTLTLVDTRVVGMANIYRYDVPIDDEPHRFVLSGDIVHVDCRDPMFVEFWAVHYGDNVSRPRWFQVYGTGHFLPENFVRVVGSVVSRVGVNPGALVWHLVEVRVVED